MFNRFAFLFVSLACLAPAAGWAGVIGEVAPPLQTTEWVHGDPVAIQPGTNIYVLDIWLTTISDCRKSIPFVNDVEKRFKTNGVVVVGVCDEPVGELKEFFRNEGTNVAFAVAADDHQQTSHGYMNLVLQRGLPYAFVIGTNGCILWHGIPAQDLDRALAAIVSGRYDVERAKKVELVRHQMEQYLTLIQNGDSRSKDAGKILLAGRTNDVALLCDLAMQIMENPGVRKRDMSLANQALLQAEQLPATNIDRVMLVRAIYLFDTGHRDEGVAKATAALAVAKTPADKAVIQARINAMNSRLAAIKAHSAATNQVNSAPSEDMISKTNQNADPVGEGSKPAGNP